MKYKTRRLFSIVLALVMCAGLLPAFALAAGESYYVGDVNGDGKVTNADVTILSRYLKGWDGYAAKIKNMDAADINRDGYARNNDVTLLARAVKGWTSPEKYWDKYIKPVS